MTEPQPRLLHAAAWIAGAIVSFSAMMVGGRELAGSLSTFEILAWRSAIGLPVVLAAVLWADGWRGLASAQPGLHVLRNTIHFGAQNLWFYGVAVIPLAQLVTLEFTNPIWVALLAPALLGEPLSRAKMMAAGLGFAGVLVIAQPGAGPLHWGHAAALGAAVGFALTNIATKRLSRRDGPLTVLFWMIFSQMLMGFAVAVPMGLSPIPPAAWPWVLLVALTGLTAHFCLTRALFIAPASIVGPMEFARLPVVAVVGMLLYGEAIGLSVLAGAVLILAGNAVNVRAGRLSRA
jgi:drug/metabolite transporter (DMT)-like permease